ncbi:MAG: electron transfer flavoprotein subunit beta/FixA family protein [Burkholderiales bacterium]
MKIVVCVKEIPDPDVAASVFEVDEAARAVVPVPGLRSVASPFDEQAVEVALRLRDKLGSASISLLTLGEETARAIVKNGLALGADDAYLLVDEAFEGSDATTTARALAAAIRKIGAVDLVLAGRQAADSDAGVVGLGIAEFLGIPAITWAGDVAIEERTVVVERSLGDGSETVAAPLPALVSVSHEVGKVRPASLRETMKAARKPVTVWTAADLGVPSDEIGASGARRVLERLTVPKSDVRCEFLTGDGPEALAAALIERLAAAKLV